MTIKHRHTTISIPIELNDKVKKKINGTGFHSVSSYVTYILRSLLTSSGRISKLSREDERRVKEQLKGLGY